MPTFDATGRQRWCESPDASTFDAAGRLYTLVLKSGGIEAKFPSMVLPTRCRSSTFIDGFPDPWLFRPARTMRVVIPAGKESLVGLVGGQLSPLDQMGILVVIRVDLKWPKTRWIHQLSPLVRKGEVSLPPSLLKWWIAMLLNTP